MGIFVSAISVINGKLFKANLEEVAPYLAAGFVVWTFISGVLGEACSIYRKDSGIIQELPIKLHILIFRFVFFHLIILAHNLLVVVGVWVVFSLNPGVALLMFIPGLFLAVLTAFSLAASVAILGTRFRDIEQIVLSVLQLLFFASPILWMPRLIGEDSLILRLNPIAYFLDVLRSPLLGEVPSLESYAVCSLVCLVSGIGAIRLHLKFSNRVVLWV